MGILFIWATAVKILSTESSRHVACTTEEHIEAGPD